MLAIYQGTCVLTHELSGGLGVDGVRQCGDGVGSENSVVNSFQPQCSLVEGVRWTILLSIRRTSSGRFAGRRSRCRHRGDPCRLIDLPTMPPQIPYRSNPHFTIIDIVAKSRSRSPRDRHKDNPPRLRRTSHRQDHANSRANSTCSKVQKSCETLEVSDFAERTSCRSCTSTSSSSGQEHIRARLERAVEDRVG